MARHQQLRPSELRAAIGLSRLWKAQQQGERARKTLTEIYATFSEGFDYADLKIAQAELQSLPPSV